MLVRIVDGTPKFFNGVQWLEWVPLGMRSAVCPDVPLCLRRKLKDSNESSSSKRKTYEEKESRSSTKSTKNE